MEKIEQIKKAMEIVKKQIALQESCFAVKTKTEKEEILSAYRKLSGIRLTEYDRDVNGLAYCELNRHEYGNELINIDEDGEAEDLVEVLKIADVKKFTISLTSTALMETLVMLDKTGYKPSGMTRVFTQYIDFDGNREMTDAIIMEMK